MKFSQAPSCSGLVPNGYCSDGQVCNGGTCTASGWQMHSNKHCTNDRISGEIFDTQEDAKHRCLQLHSCFGVYDDQCDASSSDALSKNMYLCNASKIKSADWLTSSTTGSCVLEKEA